MTHPIPDKALAQHIAVLGKTGSGKSYAIRGVVEQLLEDGARACVIDPTGTWWGLKSSSTGKRGAYPVVIFGGAHADMPLGAAHGEALAEIIGTSSTPAILDTSQMKVGERTRFFADFADALVRKNKGPLHLVIDEAHLFAPQGKVSDPQSGAMLHAANNLVSLGRSKGLRIILITQRPAKLHKDSLTQVETLVAMRLIAPQDRKAVEEWIKDNADQEKGREIISSLATLKTGQAWVWAPELGVLERVAFPRIRTFDSSAAPDDSSDGTGPVLAPIDREAIAARLKSVAIEADANDPKKLRARIAELERQAKASPAPDMNAVRRDAEAARQAYDAGHTVGARDAQLAAAAHLKGLKGALHQAIENAIAGTLAPAVRVSTHPPSKQLKPATREALVSVARAAAMRPRIPGGNGSMGAAERKFLTVLAQRQGKRTTRNQVAVFSGYSAKSRHVDNTLGTLRAAGHAEGGGDDIRITREGLKALGNFDPLPTGAELRDYWLREAGGAAEAAMLRVILEAYPDTLTRDEVAEASNYSPTSRHVDNTLGRLRSLELIAGPGAAIRASDELFE